MYLGETLDQFRLNYEEQTQYKIRIQFSNQFELFEENFFINIEDINESPYHLQCSNQTGFCTALDEDFNQTLKFQIKTMKNFHYEIICTDNGQPPLSVSTWIKVLPDDLTLIFVPIYSLIIPVDDDNNNNKIDKQTRDNIVILYSNDGDKTERQRRQANSPPQDIYFNMFYLNVPENSRDFQIASVYVVDDDNENYTCSMYTYNVPDDRQPFEINNGILQTSLTMHNNNYDLDFETVPIYNITVTCYDPIHHFSISKNFSIDVQDINEAPVELCLIPNTLPENSLAGYIIGHLHTIDPDIFSVNQTFEYTIVTDPNNMFSLDNDQLILTRNNEVELCISQPDSCPHDYEQINSLYVRIRVEDNGEPPASQKFWIQIKLLDENDPPVNLQLDENLVKENSPIGTLVGTFSVQDEDFYQIQTFHLRNENPLSINGNLFFIEDNSLRLARSPDYEQQPFLRISVQAIDNGTIPQSITNDFLIEILDMEEFPNTYIFIPNIDDIVSNDTIKDLINGKEPVRTIYLPENAYFQPSLGRIGFLMEDRNRDIYLKGSNDTNNNELAFSKPSCKLLTEIPYRLFCTSIVTVDNPRSIDEDGHLIITPLKLTSNNKTMTFPKVLRIKFENITLTIDGKPIESIDIPKQNLTGMKIGLINAIDLAAGEQLIENVTLNPNNSLSYPLEIVNSSILKVLDDLDFSLINSSSMYNVSVFVPTNDDDHRIIEKYLIVNIKDKMDLNLLLSNNKIMENSHENIFIGNLILENGIGNYTFELIENGNGRFQLNGTNLFTAGKYIEHCHINHTCPLDHETEPIINITIAVRDPSTNKTLQLIYFPIQIEDENESPYNLTLSTEIIPENTTIDSIVSLIKAMDDDLNQTLTYTTNNPIFNIINNQLILKTKLNYNKQQWIPLIIRANDNGQPSISTEKFFLINISAVNRPPINVTSTPMIAYLTENLNSTSIIVGQFHIIDPDVNENFTVTFNKPNFRALTPAMNSYSIIRDDGSVTYAQVYNISIVDLSPPTEQDKIDYLLNITANITDTGNHSISHEFFVRYIPRSIINSTIVSTIPPLTTTTGSLSQVLHIRIYESTPSNIPIIRGLLNSSSLNNPPICTAIDDRNSSFLINTTQSSFIISLPTNYSLNSTIRPTILINIQCTIANGTNIHQDIVIDVLPAPPTIKINFNQTKPFYVTNNHTLLGTFSTIQLTTIPTNRTYNLSLINNEDIFKLLSNGSLLQIGSYPSYLLEFDNPFVNLTIQSIETTPNEPIRIIQTIFSIPIIINFTQPTITFSRTSIPNDTNPNTIIGNLIVHNLTTPYRLQLLDTYNNGLELDPNTQNVILKRAINTFPLMNNQTEFPIKIQLINEINGTILTTIFPLTITYSCLNTNCENGRCIQLNQRCISKDKLEYFIFDYFNDYKTIDVINDQNLSKKIWDFIQKNFFSIENIVLSSRRILGPEKYHRAELISIEIPSSNTTLNQALEIFCRNQSLINNSFDQEICSGYQQAIYLEKYFQSTPKFCPNCSFIDAADRYYWFDRTIPFLPLWITLIVGSILMTAIPLISSISSPPKKVVLPLIKAKMRVEDEQEEEGDLILTKSVRTTVKFSHSSFRERNDSGYESNEDTENYCEQIINNYQQEEEVHIYPVLHGTSSSNNPPRSISMFAEKTRRESSIENSQTLKPILQRRSTLFDSTIETLIHSTGTPKLNHDDETYLSTRFRNENTSKFVIGTLWNTFALVNNLFLQRPRKRRNALSGESNIQAEELAHLEQLYSLAEHNQEHQYSTNHLQTILTEPLLEPQTKNLQSIVFDILSSSKESRCTCYGNHHIPSCIYYDHSLPYIKRFIDTTIELENIFHDILKSNKPKYQDAATQSYIEKPKRTFTHLKSTNNVATQSSPMRNKTNISTQTIDQNLESIEYTKILSQIKSKPNPEEILPRKTSISTKFHPKKIEDNNIYDRRNSLMNELKQVLTSSIPKSPKINKEPISPPNHTVRSLVSMFETTSVIQKSNLLNQEKVTTNNPQVLTPPDSILLNISTEEIHSSMIHNTIEQYANGIALNIVDNAVLTATTTTVCHNEQLQRRFSFYKNGGGHGKSLLFQANTFVPLTNQQGDQNIRVESQSSDALLNDPLSSTIPIHTENESQHTLIVGRYVNGNESNRSKRRKYRSLTPDTKFHFDSSSSEDDEQIDHRQFLSNSQLFSAQQLYIRPWLVRQSTAPNIHSLDTDIHDTHLDRIYSSETFFSIFPKNNNLDFYTRYTSLITILFYLRDIHDEYSNQILYDEINQIEKQLTDPVPTSSSTMIHSNVFQTINPDGSKRYRTGLTLDINSFDQINRRKIFAKQIEWKRVKVIIRRFRKKYQSYKQLMKIDQKIPLNQLNIENYLKYFDSTSRRRIEKYAKHYAQK